MDFVITVCDQAAGETCPFWPGVPIAAHWGLPDPAAIESDDEAAAQAFLDTALALKRRIELLLALPADVFDQRTVQGRVDAIGTS